jgi:hypothetical protein
LYCNPANGTIRFPQEVSYRATSNSISTLIFALSLSSTFGLGTSHE